MKPLVKKIKTYFSNITWLNFGLLTLVFSILSFSRSLGFTFGYYLDGWSLGYWVLAILILLLGYQSPHNLELMPFSEAYETYQTLTTEIIVGCRR